nr:hypothetical protein [Tanacetum cinerariifolium]
MKKAKKVSRHEFFIQQCPRGSSEGSGVTPEVLDELILKSSNEGAGVIPEVPDEPTNESNKINDEKDEEEHDGNQKGNEQAGDAQAEVHASKTQSEHPKATKVCSRMTLSSIELIQRISLTGFPARSIGSSNAGASDSLYLLVLITETSQSRQHGSHKSPTTVLFDVDTGRISIRHCEMLKSTTLNVLARSHG